MTEYQWVTAKRPAPRRNSLSINGLQRFSLRKKNVKKEKKSAFRGWPHHIFWYASHMTATEEALAAMKKAEENWDKMVDEVVEVSGQFQKECQELKVELEESK